MQGENRTKYIEFARQIPSNWKLKVGKLLNKFLPFLSGFVHLLTNLIESFANCLPGSTNLAIWSIF